MAIHPNTNLKPNSPKPPIPQTKYYINCRSCGAPCFNSCCEYCGTSFSPVYTQKQSDTHVHIAVLKQKLFGEPRVGFM